MTEELLAVLLSAAISLSGLPPVDVSELPPILHLSHDDMVREVCPTDRASCVGMVAFFDVERQRILLDETLNMEVVEDNSFVVHEMVHVLQFKQHGHKMYEDCAASRKTEAQAYRVQNAYLRKAGRLLYLYPRLAFADCSGAERAPA